MKVRRNDPPPAPQPPPTYDILGLSAEEVQVLMEVCQRSTWVGERVGSTF